MHTDFNARSFIEQATSVYNKAPLPEKSLLQDELETLPAVFTRDQVLDAIYKNALLAGLEWLREGQGKIAIYNQTEESFSSNENANELDDVINNAALESGIEDTFKRILAQQKQDSIREETGADILENLSPRYFASQANAELSEMEIKEFEIGLERIRESVLRVVAFVSEFGWREFINGIQDAKKIDFDGGKKPDTSEDFINAVYAQKDFEEDLERDNLALTGENKILFAKPKNLKNRDVSKNASLESLFEYFLKPMPRRTYHLTGFVVQPQLSGG